MTALTVIVPSHGRPAAAVEVVAAFRETCIAATRLVFAVDADDPQLEEYLDLLTPGRVDVYIAPAPSTMVRSLNAAALHYAPDTFALAFLGDDHRPRTAGWDHYYIHALRVLGTGFVYGNDLLQGENIPTQVAMTADIVQALGHMAPPVLTHLYVDNYWKDLGQGADCLTYLPDVIVEHMHPYAGKAELDEGYRRVNARTMYAQDSAAYAVYTNRHILGDIKKILALR